jgi:hypothetical protein
MRASSRYSKKSRNAMRLSIINSVAIGIVIILLILNLVK